MKKMKAGVLPIFLAACSLALTACNKKMPNSIEEIPNSIEAELEINKLVCYPDDSIYFDFSLIIEAEKEPFSLQWIHPDTFSGTGPFIIGLKEDLLLNVLINDAENEQLEYLHTIQTDTIDPLNYDYREKYYGAYAGERWHHNGETRDPPFDTTYLDTTFVEMAEELDEIKVNGGRDSFDYINQRFTTDRSYGTFFSEDSITWTSYSGPDGSVDIRSKFRGQKISKN